MLKKPKAPFYGAFVRMKGLEPPRLSAPDPKSGAAAITPHPHLFLKNKEAFYCLFILLPGLDLNQ
jgi:hypothetical protein